VNGEAGRPAFDESVEHWEVILALLFVGLALIPQRAAHRMADERLDLGDEILIFGRGRRLARRDKPPALDPGASHRGIHRAHGRQKLA